MAKQLAPNDIILVTERMKRGTSTFRLRVTWVDDPAPNPRNPEQIRCYFGFEPYDEAARRTRGAWGCSHQYIAGPAPEWGFVSIEVVGHEKPQPTPWPDTSFMVRNPGYDLLY